MLFRPNLLYDDGKYLPYLKSEISYIYNTFDIIVKKKYHLIDPVENQKVLIESVNYINNTRFTINKDVLNFVVGEWFNDESKLFEIWRGVNKLKIIEGSESN